MKYSFLLVTLLFSLLVTSCQNCCYDDINPCITHTPQQRHIANLPSPFEPLTADERAQDWGKEHTIATSFARDLDLYRAITTYKRALALSPPKDRLVEMEYSIALCYFLSKKYCDVINMVENSDLIDIQTTFPAYRDLLVMLYESYQSLGYCDRAARVLLLLEQEDCEAAESLPISSAIRQGDTNTLSCHKNHPGIDDLLSCYCRCKKQPHTAQALSAIIPGAGYLYVGQCKTALTSFVINSLFIWAAVRFFDQGHTAAGIITTSLEMGWYFGGIHGSALAAKEYNECRFESCGTKTMLQQRLFPVLMSTRVSNESACFRFYSLEFTALCSSNGTLGQRC